MSDSPTLKLPPSFSVRLKRLAKPADVLPEDRKMHQNMLMELLKKNPSTVELAQFFIDQPAICARLRHEAYRSFRLARITGDGFPTLEKSGTQHTLKTGCHRQRDAIVGHLQRCAEFQPDAVWYEIGRITFRAFYQEWLQNDVQTYDRPNFPTSI